MCQQKSDLKTNFFWLLKFEYKIKAFTSLYKQILPIVRDFIHDENDWMNEKLCNEWKFYCIFA